MARRCRLFVAAVALLLAALLLEENYNYAGHAASVKRPTESLPGRAIHGLEALAGADPTGKQAAWKQLSALVAAPPEAQCKDVLQLAGHWRKRAGAPRWWKPKSGMSVELGSWDVCRDTLPAAGMARTELDSILPGGWQDTVGDTVASSSAVPKGACVVYSFATAADVRSDSEWAKESFPHSMAAQGCEVYEFDPSLERSDHDAQLEQPAKDAVVGLHFYALTLGARDTDDYRGSAMARHSTHSWKVRMLNYKDPSVSPAASIHP